MRENVAWKVNRSVYAEPSIGDAPVKFEQQARDYQIIIAGSLKS